MRGKLGVDLSRKLNTYIVDRISLCKEIDTDIALVHGDFRPINMIVTPKEELKIIDWEGTMAGHPIGDIGQFLRFGEQVSDRSERTFVEVYRHSAPLAADYKTYSNVKDIANLLQLLDSSSTLPLKDADLVKLIAETVYSAI